MEAIVAIFVITAGIVGVLSLVTQTISSAIVSEDKLIAAYLAQEGIEIIRNIRDTNWIEAETYFNDWNEGLTGCSGGCEADYTTSSILDPTLPSYNGGRFLKIDGGFYNYTSGTDTKFKRKITISELGTVDCPAGVCLNVAVLVEWQEKGKPFNVPAQENLYNWYQ